MLCGMSVAENSETGHKRNPRARFRVDLKPSHHLREGLVHERVPELCGTHTRVRLPHPRPPPLP